jgi:dihydrofolate reductase
MGRVTYQGMAGHFPTAAGRRQGDGEILAHGGLSFAQQLASHDLVDEYRLNVFPFVARSGRTLFAEVAKPAELELVSSTASTAARSRWSTGGRAGTD